MRRRRRRSSFGRSSYGGGGPSRRWIMFGAGAVLLVGAFLFFMRQADELAPAPQEIRIDLPDAFKG